MRLREDPEQELLDRRTFDFAQKPFGGWAVQLSATLSALPLVIFLLQNQAGGPSSAVLVLYLVGVVGLFSVRRRGQIRLTANQVRIDAAGWALGPRVRAVLPTQDLRLEWTTTTAVLALNAWDVTFTTPTGTVPIPNVQCTKRELERLREAFEAFRSAGVEAAGSPEDVPETLRQALASRSREPERP